MRSASPSSRLLRRSAAVILGAGLLFAVEMLAAWSASRLIIAGLR
jgi:hypothetical protein